MRKTSIIRLDEALNSRLLTVGDDVSIDSSVLFCFTGYNRKEIPLVIDSGVRIDFGTVIYGGVHLKRNTIIESYCVIGRPEYGYALQKNYKGDLHKTEIGENSIIRSTSIIYSGTTIGSNTTIGHYCLLRSFVKVGNNTQVAHYNSIERGTTIGSFVRMSPQSHITAETTIEDNVFIGAGVKTINDKSMVWKKNVLKPDLNPPIFREGSRIGSGSTIGSGVVIGKNCMIGSASLVLKDIPDYSIAYGHPARVVEEK